MKKYPKQGFCIPNAEGEVDMVYCEDCEMECEFKKHSPSERRECGGGKKNG